MFGSIGIVTAVTSQTDRCETCRVSFFRTREEAKEKGRPWGVPALYQPWGGAGYAGEEEMKTLT